MNLDFYFRKIYTVAFRLTGDETKAVNLAHIAVNSSSDLKLTDKIDSSMIECSANEVCRLFLSDTNNGNDLFRRLEKNTYPDCFQEALMSLNKINRATVVWRDVLGLKLDNMNIKGYTKRELYLELNKGRKLLMNILNEEYINKTGA